ncbi:MAG TPA: enolase C-terminal domain-like protein [Kofleriaceae bacterium]|jgi:L-alanine-DL-glutamate epimerase-like enolase superfamily enzyme
MRAPIERVDVRVCTLATENGPESDGTAVWDATTMVIVEPRAGGVTGLGYSYITGAAATVVRDLLAPVVVGSDAFAIPATMTAMMHAIRNHGRAGVVACAVSAVDTALWDLKAKLLGVPLADLFGAARTHVPVYASGGFTSSDLGALSAELAGYRAQGHRRVKIKIGREPEKDPERVRVAREVLGPDIELMVDANGAYTASRAIELAQRFAEYGVSYFEEPVTSDDLASLGLVRKRIPPGISIAAGEYGYDGWYFQRMLDANAVDILQADSTRALGFTGFLQADALCRARSMPLSSHCAPSLHAHVGAAATQLVHLEYFRDHWRMEELLFEGALPVVHGALAYDHTRPGLGLVLREKEAARHA